MELFTSRDCLLWRSVLSKYSDVLERKIAEGTTKKSKGIDLIQLDKWYQGTLPELIAGRKKPHLTKDELNQLMKWKLTRGKFRPRLTELVQQNTADEVEKVTAEAINILPNLQAAIKHLCQLKAIGPATASGVLCAAAPQLVPFMADESVLSVPGLGKLDYTLKYYMAYADGILEKMKELNTLERLSDRKFQVKPWTCHDVEIALWTFYFAKKFDINTDMTKSDGPSEDELPPKKRMRKDTPH